MFISSMFFPAEASAGESPPAGAMRRFAVSAERARGESPGEAERILAAGLDPTGSLLAIGTRKGVQLRKVDSGELLWEAGFSGNFRPRCLALSPDSEFVAVGGYCGGVRTTYPDGTREIVGGQGGLFLISIGTNMGAMQLGPSSFSAGFVVFSKDGQRVVSGDMGGAIASVWELATGRLERTLEHETAIRHLTLSPDGSTLAVAQQGMDAGTAVIRLWDIRNGRVLRTLRPEKGSVSFLAFSPSGTALVSAGGSRARAFRATDGADLSSPDLRDSLELWEVATGRRVQQFSVPASQSSTSDRNVHAVAFSVDGKHLVSAERDGTIRVYAVASGRPMYTFHFNLGPEPFPRIFADGQAILIAKGSELTMLNVEALGPDLTQDRE